MGHKTQILQQHQHHSASGAKEFGVLHRECKELESKLRSLVKSKGFEGEAVKVANRLSKSYRELIVAFPKESALNDVAASMWKSCFYKEYEHVKSKLSRAKMDGNKQLLKQHLVKLRHFFAHASNLFAQFSKTLATLMRQDVANAKFHAQSLHNCNIFMGDIARYREIYGDQSKKSWAKAAQCYYEALEVMPKSGNPHNQLAVLEMYMDNECVAVYRYIRAFVTQIPFEPAKDNIRLTYERALKRGFGPVVTLTTGLVSRTERDQMRVDFFKKFIYVNSTLYFMDIPSNDAFIEQVTVVSAILASLIQTSAVNQDLQYAVVIILIFTVFHLEEHVHNEQQQNILARNPQRPVSTDILTLAKGFVLMIIGTLSKNMYVPATEQPKKYPTASVVPLTLFCDWVAGARPNFFSSEPIVANPAPLSSSAVAFLETSMHKFWASMAESLNRTYRFALEAEVSLDQHVARPALAEELKVFSFSPFTPLYEPRCSVDQHKPLKEGRETYAIRCNKLRTFGLWACRQPEPRLFYNHDRSEAALTPFHISDDDQSCGSSRSSLSGAILASMNPASETNSSFTSHLAAASLMAPSSLLNEQDAVVETPIGARDNQTWPPQQHHHRQHLAANHHHHHPGANQHRQLTSQHPAVAGNQSRAAYPGSVTGPDHRAGGGRHTVQEQRGDDDDHLEEVIVMKPSFRGGNEQPQSVSRGTSLAASSSFGSSTAMGAIPQPPAPESIPLPSMSFAIPPTTVQKPQDDDDMRRNLASIWSSRTQFVTSNHAPQQQPSPEPAQRNSAFQFYLPGPAMIDPSLRNNPVARDPWGAPPLRNVQPADGDMARNPFQPTRVADTTFAYPPQSRPPGL